MKKQNSIRGLNHNCNHDLKNLFKGAAIVASCKPGPLQEFYTALLSKGMRPEMARLTLARKIATIVLLRAKSTRCNTHSPTRTEALAQGDSPHLSADGPGV